ncbi:gamma-secretase subunit Aph-1 [Halyomorpha halys]|uniref:gamma-secretase subunit Aph-1 n=1 Tax=Halyomorpha halys TaxID=286706 RepID=UPI0006D514F2|nr:gamma-secretase subunit Aph-1 [Halyomorpha halys]
MTLMEFVGCACTAYSPVLTLCMFTVFHDPIRIIILVASAFYWLLSLLLSAIFWNYVTFRHVLPLCIIVSVIFQEIFRYIMYYILKKAEQGLKKINVPSTNKDITSNKHVVPFVSGLGFGVMSGCFSLANILAELAGPGTVGLKGGSEYFGLISSVHTMIFTLLHTFWSVIFFPAVEERNFWQLSWVVGSHLLVSCMTLFNQSDMFYVSLPVAFLVLLFTAYISLCCVCKRSVQSISLHEHVQS